MRKLLVFSILIGIIAVIMGTLTDIGIIAGKLTVTSPNTWGGLFGMASIIVMYIFVLRYATNET